MARRRRDGWSPPPEPGGPVTPVVGIMPPMPAQPLRHEGFTQAPPLQRRLHLTAFDHLQPGRRTLTGPAPEPSGEPEFTHRNGERYHRQGRSLDRLDAPAGFAGDAQHHRLTPGGLDCNQTRRSRRPDRSVHPRTRAPAPPARSAPPPDRRCSCRTPERPDARTGTGNDTTGLPQASASPLRTGRAGPAARRGRRPARRSERPAAARRRAQCPRAASALPVLSRFAPVQPTDPRVRLGARAYSDKENVLVMFRLCGNKADGRPRLNSAWEPL